LILQNQGRYCELKKSFEIENMAKAFMNDKQGRIRKNMAMLSYSGHNENAEKLGRRFGTEYLAA
jgi:hypothetical protein